MKALFLAALSACLLQAEPAPVAVVLAPPEGREKLAAAVRQAGWEVVAPDPAPLGDRGLKALEEMLAKRPFTPRTYLIAAADDAWMAAYAASRVPHLFAAVLAIGGSARPAIQTNRLFAANAALVPVYWVDPDDAVTRLANAGFPVRSGPADLAQLGASRLDSYPETADCETGNTAFGRCYWVTLQALDPAQRNDAVTTSRIVPGAGASLAFGPFGYSQAAPGPGILVAWLPPEYKGPLKLDDRILALDGKPISDAHGYQSLMDEMVEEKPVVAMIQRGGERRRLETRTVVPKREELFTARVRAQYLADSKEILVVTRGVAALTIDVPPQWEGARVNWNGEERGAARAGAMVLKR
ncbi:MAG: hypothetical protein SFV54_23020 [Bryobacteraceae bacterium]|nr:hypothetical protein [Bryobacteraceae bacterium]